GVDDLRVARGLAQAHVHDDLLDLRNGHDVGVAELLAERAHDFLLIAILQAAHLSTTPSHLRQIRTLRPSSSTRCPMRVGALHSGQTSCTFEACSGASFSRMPPLTPRCGFGRVWRLTKLMPSTTRRFLSAITRSTRPFLPRSLPAITCTLSLRRIGVCNRDIGFLLLQHFRRERNDLHEPALAQLTRHRPEYARANRLVLVVDEHGGVPVEPDVAAVAAAEFLPRAHDDRLDHLALLDRAVRRRFLHRRGDDVAEPRIAARRSADRIDHRNLAGARVVGDVENRSHLNHGCLPFRSWWPSRPRASRPSACARSAGASESSRRDRRPSPRPSRRG